MGKARSPALGSRSWCRRSAIWAAIALIGACGSDEVTHEPAPRERPPARDEAPSAPAPPRPPARYYEGYLAEILDGDALRASEAYREVMDLADSREAILAARAALHLAQLEAWRGNRREAVELVARAAALGGQDPDVVERADNLQDELSLVQATGAEDVRGPPLLTDLTGVSEEAKAKFAKAEKLSRSYYRNGTRPRIEDPQAGARSRQRSAELAERAYGAVIDLGEPAAAVAAEFRIGSLYHDLAVSLVSEQPPELERRSLGRLRRQQKVRAARYYRTARAAYRRALAFGQDDSSDRWRREAQKGLESVEVLLRGSE